MWGEYQKMISKLITLVVLVVLIGSPSQTFADEDSEATAKTEFYDFDAMLINGKVRKPQLLWVNARQKVKFERLLKLRKNLMPRLMATGKDRALK